MKAKFFNCLLFSQLKDLSKDSILFLLKQIKGGTLLKKKWFLDVLYSHFLFSGNRPRTDDDLNTVIYAHSMIRNAPLTDQYAKSLRQVESFSLDTLRSLEGERGSVSAADIAAIARNITDPYSTSNERVVCASGHGSSVITDKKLISFSRL